MSYLPYNSIVNRLMKKRTRLVVPDKLIGSEWPFGNRVKIIPSQTFCGVQLDELDEGDGKYRDKMDYCVTSRQHRMPHNSQLATTIQTLGFGGGMGSGDGNDVLQLAETFTICSTPANGLYWASYVLYRVGGGGVGGGDRVTFDKSQIVVDLQLSSQTLEDIRWGLLGTSRKITFIPYPVFYFGPRLR